MVIRPWLRRLRLPRRVLTCHNPTSLPLTLPRHVLSLQRIMTPVLQALVALAAGVLLGLLLLSQMALAVTHNLRTSSDHLLPQKPDTTNLAHVSDIVLVVFGYPPVSQACSFRLGTGRGVSYTGPCSDSSPESSRYAVRCRGLRSRPTRRF